MLLDSRIITSAVSGVASAATFVGPSVSLAIQVDFLYGSGGTSGVVYLQTSIDGGVNWCDIVNMTFTTASKTRVHNLSTKTPVTTPYAPTDGTLGSDSAKDGVLGPVYRTKLSSVGTYGGNTTISVTVLPQP